jgi:signal transduction histidine kinase
LLFPTRILKLSLLKKHHLKYFLGITLLICLFSAVLIDQSDQSKYLQKLARHSQNVIERKQKLLNKDLGVLRNAIAKQEAVLKRYENFTEFEKDLKEDGFVLLAFERDSLVFWSDNSFLVPPIGFLDQYDLPVMRAKNGWYYLQKQEMDSITLYGFLLIKRIYPYQNKFLKNHYPKYLNIPDSYEISLDKEAGQAVYDAEGNYLFTIEVGEFQFGVQDGQGLLGALYGLSLLLFVLLCSIVIREIKNPKWGLVSFGIWGLALLGIRYLMLSTGFPSVFSELELFSPILFASSFFFPSLGDFLINAFFLFIFIYSCARYYIDKNIGENRTGIWFQAWFIFHVFIFAFLFQRISGLFVNLVMDSSINFQMFLFQDSNYFVFVGILILLLMFFALGQLAYLIAMAAKDRWNKLKFFGITIFAVFLANLILSYFIEVRSGWYYWLFPVGMFLLLGFIALAKDKGTKYSLFVLLLILVSAAVTNRINVYSQMKEHQDRKVAAMNLSTEYDATSENLLVKLQDQLKSDERLRLLSRHPFRNEVHISNYIQNRYFKGYWEQYHLQVTICDEMDDLTIQPDNRVRNCYEFFQEMIDESGEAIPGTDFYYLNEFDGMVSYLGILEVSNFRSERIKIFLRLDSKVGSEGLGYPELLLDEKVDLRPIRDEYSYGKYQNGQLISSSGDFTYFMSSKVFGDKQKDIFWTNLEGYSHLIYQFDNNTVVVSKPLITWYNRLVTIPYMFVFFYLFAVIVWLFSKFPWKPSFNLSFKYRIQYSIVGLLMLFFLLLGGGTVYYTISQAEEANNKNLQEKLSLIKREVLTDIRSNLEVDLLTDHLRQLSGLIYADIHLYDMSGELITSSREEIFTKKLQASKMNFAAYYQMFHKQRTSFIHKEEIGEMSYLSAYEALLDENNKPIAFVNLPYFLKSQELEKEMFNLILAGVNLHVFMILLAIFISVIISNKITSPLRTIQNRLKATRFGSYGEQIEYDKNDEIGNLVKEYNQMLIELEKSAAKLARSERESAWREMARQIAHEIKNPLTPMKLSIQFLQKRLEDKSENWEEHFNQVSKTLIEQINTLSSIATAFSNFAKMPLAKNHEVNLVEILQHVISLFRNDDLDLKLYLNGIDDAKIFVDKEQFVRVFVNLINNAIQSIPEDRPAKVVLEIEDDNRYYKASVIDNGTGISDDVKDKLFYPNFTTKSGGMGLGLAIVKNIVENARGKIWVESEEGVGSCFFIEIPKYTEEK